MHFTVVITAEINLVTMSGETDFRDLVGGGGRQELWVNR